MQLRRWLGTASLSSLIALSLTGNGHAQSPATWSTPSFSGESKQAWPADLVMKPVPTPPLNFTIGEHVGIDFDGQPIPHVTHTPIIVRQFTVRFAPNINAQVSPINPAIAAVAALDLAGSELAETFSVIGLRYINITVGSAYHAVEQIAVEADPEETGITPLDEFVTQPHLTETSDPEQFAAYLHRLPQQQLPSIDDAPEINPAAPLIEPERDPHAIIAAGFLQTETDDCPGERIAGVRVERVESTAPQAIPAPPATITPESLDQVIRRMEHQLPGGNLHGNVKPIAPAEVPAADTAPAPTCSVWVPVYTQPPVQHTTEGSFLPPPTVSYVPRTESYTSAPTPQQFFNPYVAMGSPTAQVYRQTIKELEAAADRFEELAQYSEADELRTAAQRLRVRQREHRAAATAPSHGPAHQPVIPHLPQAMPTQFSMPVESGSIR